MSAATSKHLQRLLDEGEELLAQSRTYQKALSMSDYASPNESGDPAGNYAFPRVKMLGTGGAPRVAPLSPLQLDDQQMNALWQAARNKTPFRVEIGSKGLEHGLQLRDKAGPLAESGLAGQQLPPRRGAWSARKLRAAVRAFPGVGQPSDRQ
jgi:hypothetical protein